MEKQNIEKAILTYFDNHKKVKREYLISTIMWETCDSIQSLQYDIAVIVDEMVEDGRLIRVDHGNVSMISRT